MKSKHAFLMLSLLLVGARQLSAMQDQIPIPILTSEEESIIIRSPDIIRINGVYDTDNNTFIFGIGGSTESLTVSINNPGSNETYNTVFIGSGLFYVPISGNTGLWQITITRSNGSEYVGEILL
ncbi:MAG: hypothetical protein J6T22_03205 [Bacteroidales bacterium]|nr:hypothetical protein [Bacteroidales bacterium]